MIALCCLLNSRRESIYIAGDNSPLRLTSTTGNQQTILMKRILTMLEAKSVSQVEIEKMLFYAAIYSLAFFAAFQITSF